MKKLMLLGIALAAALIGEAQYAEPYKVMVPLAPELNGQNAVLVNFDTGNSIDSVVVADGMALYHGEIDEPMVARILVGGGRSPQFVLESGSIAFSKDGRKAFGSPLNDRLNEISDSLGVYSAAFEEAATDDQKQAVYDAYKSFVDKKMRENVDNPIGYILFLDLAYEMGPKELVDFIDNNPSMGKYERVQKLVESSRKKAATGEGAKYVDFEVDGKKLSEYVGKDGKYLLVDFFASWCGPCLKQLPVLKELYQKYGDKLNVLGVAVWDEPDASLRAIEQHQLPWPCIINAGTIPTDIYGISGIPCIMLIAPDGTILSRDLQGDDLKEAVAKALGE